MPSRRIILERGSAVAKFDDAFRLFRVWKGIPCYFDWVQIPYSTVSLMRMKNESCKVTVWSGESYDKPSRAAQSRPWCIFVLGVLASQTSQLCHRQIVETPWVIYVCQTSAASDFPQDHSVDKFEFDTTKDGPETRQSEGNRIGGNREGYQQMLK